MSSEDIDRLMEYMESLRFIGQGATYKEAVAAGFSQQRFSDLCLMQRIVWNGEKRDGCRVYVVAE